MEKFNLSAHFSFSEMCFTSVNLPNVCSNPEHVKNLVRLCDILEVIRDHVNKPIRVNSAFRSPAVNRAVGGVVTSDHLIGCAADICVVGMSSEELFHKIRSLCEFNVIECGQVILYSTFVHVSINRAKHCNQFISRIK